MPRERNEVELIGDQHGHKFVQHSNVILTYDYPALDLDWLLIGIMKYTNMAMFYTFPTAVKVFMSG